MDGHRYLLIKAWSNGFWSSVEHVIGALLITELVNRTPVVFWGADSLYRSDDPYTKDAFTMYFLPVSTYSIDHVENAGFSYYPLRWNAGNIRLPGAIELSELDGSCFFHRPEQVLVSNTHTFVSKLLPFIDESHPVYGLDSEDVYRYLYQKYIRLQPSLHQEIESFYSSTMLGRHPIIGVHIRGNDKIHECPNLHEINEVLCPREIDRFMEEHPQASIFLMTDDERNLLNYVEKYGDRIIHTNCLRTTSDQLSVHNIPHYSPRQKGIEIIKDTFLATKCDTFIGNGASNVSLAVNRIKSWADGTIRLF